MEILVVIVLIAMLVIIGYPILWRSRVRANLLGEVQMLQQATAVARINAVKYSRRVAMKILDGNTIQEGGLVVAWIDDNADGLQTAGEPEVGRWLLRDGYFLAPDAGNILFKLAGSSTARGVVFLPNGVTIANAAGSIGVGQGAFEVRDSHLNRIRLMIRGGSGSVIREMWDPDVSDWSEQIRFWRY